MKVTKRPAWLFVMAASLLTAVAASAQPAGPFQPAEQNLELRVYQVADLLVPTPDYPYPGGLPTAAPFRSGGYGGIGGYGSGFGGGMGGLGGGGMGGLGGGGMGMYGPSGMAGATMVGQGFSGDETGQAGLGGPGGESTGASSGGTRSTTGLRPSVFQNVDDLISVIVETVSPESWQDVGRPGSIAHLGTLLIVSQTPEVHKQIERLLEMLRTEGGQSQTVVVEAVWLVLDSDNLARLVPPGGGSPVARITVDTTALEQFVREVPSLRGRITCFSGQTVHLVGGNRRTVVVSAIPVAGGTAVGYQPVIAAPNIGALLQVCPMLLPKSDAAVLDLQSTVTAWEEGGKPFRVRAQALPGQAPAGAPGMGTAESPGETTAAEVDRVNLATQQLAATLRVPLGKPVLVGGLTLAPNQAPADDDGKPQERRQLYLVVRISAVQDTPPPTPKE